jgi:hypothetical protein
VVEQTIADHCRIRGWHLHVVNCRSNHVHVVVTAPVSPQKVEEQFKAWCTRRLKELERRRRDGSADRSPIRKHWWQERGSRRYINDEDGLAQAVIYVRDLQDEPRTH